MHRLTSNYFDIEGVRWFDSGGNLWLQRGQSNYPAWVGSVNRLLSIGEPWEI